MGKHIGLSLVLIFLIFFLPWLWAQPAPAEPGEPGGTLPPPADSLPDQEPAPEDADPPAQSLDAARSLRVKTGSTLTEMDIETYLLGVVRAETSPRPTPRRAGGRRPPPTRPRSAGPSRRPTASASSTRARRFWRRFTPPPPA